MLFLTNAKEILLSEACGNRSYTGEVTHDFFSGICSQCASEGEVAKEETNDLDKFESITARIERLERCVFGKARRNIIKTDE
jgi:hypothetical protein